MTSGCLSLFLKKIMLFLYKLFWTWKSLTVHDFTDSRQRVCSFIPHGDNMVINFIINTDNFVLDMKDRLKSWIHCETSWKWGCQFSVTLVLISISKWSCCAPNPVVKPKLLCPLGGISCSPFALFSLLCPEKPSAQKHHCSCTASPGAGFTLGSAAPLFDGTLEQMQIKKLRAELQDLDFFNDKNSCSQDCILMSNKVFLF